jgi:iron complex transport system ATP-binding protein
MLAARNLTAGYGGQPVVWDVSVDIRPNELLALLGPNGSGKSTLLSVLCGVVRNLAGEVLLEGKPILGMDRRGISRKVAYVPQQAAFTQPFRVEEIVGMGRSCWLGPFEAPGEEDKRRVDEALRSLDLEKVRHKAVTELSGGEAQRACIARAFAQGTPVGLFDEPTSSLDPRHSLLVMGQLSRLARQGRGVVVALHDVNLALRYADRLAFMREGRLLAVLPPGEVDGQVLESVFDVPWGIATDPHGFRQVFPV